MSVVVNNLQKLVYVNKSLIGFHTKLLMKIAGYESFDLGVMLVNNDRIRNLNVEYRGVDEVTDVLAFPYHQVPENMAGQLPDVHGEERMLGDIVLGVPYILKESQMRSADFKHDLLTHITHGMFHLVGYDHETKRQWSRMHSKELETLTQFNSITGYRCSPLLGIGHTENS